jgi:hypothetical protein
MSVSECIKLYEELGEKIFSTSASLVADTKFSSSVLEKVLYDVVKKHRPVTESYQPESYRLMDTTIGQPGSRCPM